MNALSGPSSHRRTKAAGHLLQTSEYYFDGKKLDRIEREHLLWQLLALADDSDPLVREAVTRLTGLLNQWSDVTQRILGGALRDATTEVQAQAVSAVGTYKESAAPLLPDLLALANHPESDVRFRVAWAIPRLGIRSPSIMQILVGLSADVHRTTRMYAILALPYCLPGSGAEVFHLLAEALRDPAAEVRGQACMAIARIEHDWTLLRERLWDVFHSNLHGLQIDAIIALCRHWPELTRHEEISAWLNVNQGYWWVEDLLAGVQPDFGSKPT
jgi:hypothetical protein